MSIPLYEIAKEIKHLSEMETDGDVSFEEAIHNSLDDLNLSFNDKIENIVKLNQSMDGDITLIDVEIKRLTERKGDIIKRQNHLKQYVLNTMLSLEKKTVKTPLFTVTSAKGRDKVIIDNESEIPDEYINVRVTESPDKKAILNALKAGDITGCHLEKSGNTLRIK